jgi:phosphomannomutase/phosphoglucomutase
MIAGETLSAKRIQALYTRIIENDFTTGHGTSTSINIDQDYIGRIKSDIKLEKELNIVIDCGNGVAGNIAPQLFEALGVNITKLFCLVDGRFPNHHPDPSKPKNLEDLIQEVIETGADLGLAFDGDGDRLGLVDNKGKIIWADQQMMLYAKDVLSRKKGAKIIFDVKCTSQLPKVISENGGKPIMSRTGHSFIKNKLKETNAELAGEMSGHIFFKERWYGFDDALYTAARLLEIVSKSDKSCSEIFDELPVNLSTPEININFEKHGQQFDAMDALSSNIDFPDADINMIDGFRVDYENCWGLVRPSNTTPCLVLRFEAEDVTSLKEIQEKFKNWLQISGISTENI